MRSMYEVLVPKHITEAQNIIGPLSEEQHAIRTALKIEMKHNPLHHRDREASRVLRKKLYENRKILRDMNNLVWGCGQQSQRNINW